MVLWSLGARVSVAILISLGGTAAMAQQYPSKPIRFILPYLPSGPNDLIARMLAACRTFQS